MLDASVRTAYRAAHLLLRGYWRLRRPETRGSLAAVWHQGRVLIVQNSYRKSRTLPGGYVRPGEEARVAAARELREEVGIDLPADRFSLAWSGMRPFENRRDFLEIYEAEVDDAPEIQVDRREIVWADFASPDEVRHMEIVPHLLDYLAMRDARKST